VMVKSEAIFTWGFKGLALAHLYNAKRLYSIG